MLHCRTPRWSLRITRVDQPRPIAREDRQYSIEHIAHHLLGVIRPLHGAVDPVHAFQEPEMGQTLFIRLLAFGHVHDGPDEFNHIARRVEHRMSDSMEVFHRAVWKNGSVLYLERRPFTDGSIDALADPGSIIRMQTLHHGCGGRYTPFRIEAMHAVEFL